MRRIINPWSRKEGYNCFGCCPDNPIGLKLEFYEEEEWLCAQWQPTEHYNGYVNVLHGGIQSVMHDEIGGWYIYTKIKTAGVTIDLNVKFIKPANTNLGPVTIRGTLAEKDTRIAKIRTQLLDYTGNVCSEGLVTYRIYPLQVAVDKLGYPGVDAFYAG